MRTKTIASLTLAIALGTAACEKPAEPLVEANAPTPESLAQAPTGEAPAAPGAPTAPAPMEQAPAAAPSLVAAVGQPAPDFELTDETGKSHKLSDYEGKIVVLEWTNPGCPYVVRHYEADTMQKTWDAVGSEKVVWLAVDSSNFVKPEDSAKWKAEEAFKYPVLQDPSGKVGRMYEARTTPHTYVVDAEGVLRYAGAIDSDPRGGGENVTNYVSEAVNALIAGQPVPTASTKPYGCSVKYGS